MGVEQHRGSYWEIFFTVLVGLSTISAGVIALITYLSSPGPAPTPTPTSGVLPPGTNSASPLPSPVQPAPVPTQRPREQGVPTLFEGEVQLEIETGADLEGGQENGGQIRGEHSQGAIGPTDLYLDLYGLLHGAHDGLYEAQGLERDAHTRCTETINSGRSPGEVFPSYPNLYYYCFVTSDNRLAWVRVKASTTSSYTERKYVILQFKVWG